MPITVARDSQRGWLIARATGCLHIGDVLAFLNTARSRAEYRLLPLLVDARSASTDMEPRDIDAAVIAVKDATRSGPRAHVAIVSDDSRLYELLLMYEAGCAAIGVRVIRVFRLRRDAERWLDVVASASRFYGP